MFREAYLISFAPCVVAALPIVIVVAAGITVIILPAFVVGIAVGSI